MSAVEQASGFKLNAIQVTMQLRSCQNVKPIFLAVALKQFIEHNQ